jgi:methylated-DNA-[protein]-cysteine S-methyltransferase
MTSTTLPTNATTTMETPIGRLTLTARGGLLAGLYMEEHTHAPELPGPQEQGHQGFEEAIAQIEAYFTGALKRFDLPLSLNGTGFQKQVWAGLLEIPYGETVSYGELAQMVGKPGAARAVGLANGRNPVSIIVPCHRVIGANGGLVGYGGGLDRKIWLLQHEATHRWD